MWVLFCRKQFKGEPFLFKIGIEIVVVGGVRLKCGKHKVHQCNATGYTYFLLMNYNEKA